MGKIKVNDEEQEVNLPLTLSGLIKLNKSIHPDMISVQINGEPINREDFDTKPINDGDTVDIIFFMGGGA